MFKTANWSSSTNCLRPLWGELIRKRPLYPWNTEIYLPWNHRVSSSINSLDLGHFQTNFRKSHYAGLLPAPYRYYLFTCRYVCKISHYFIRRIVDLIAATLSGKLRKFVNKITNLSLEVCAMDVLRPEGSKKWRHVHSLQSVAAPATVIIIKCVAVIAIIFYLSPNLSSATSSIIKSRFTRRRRSRSAAITDLERQMIINHLTSILHSKQFPIRAAKTTRLHTGTSFLFAVVL